MLIATQISSYLIPSQVWQQGDASRSDLPPLALAARDALDIERRAQKNVNLRNEVRRYTLCCERMQGIVQDLSHTPGIHLVSAVFPASLEVNDETPTALACLALIETVQNAVERMLKGGQVTGVYPRVARVFFPPQHATAHLQVYELLRQPANLSRLFAEATRRASIGAATPIVSESQCRCAFERRRDLLVQAQGGGMGLVDVIELN